MKSIIYFLLIVTPVNITEACCECMKELDIRLEISNRDAMTYPEDKRYYEGKRDALADCIIMLNKYHQDLKHHILD